MQDTEIVNKQYSFLKTIFWANLLLALIAIIALAISKGPVFGDSGVENVYFEQYLILATLIAIPVALKLFHSQLKKIKDMPMDVYCKKYTQAYMIRLLILDMVIILNLVGFYLYESRNLLLLALISTIAIIFCYPDKKIALQDTETDNKV